MLASIYSILLLLALIIIFGTLAYGALSAAPWVPLKKKDIKRLLDLANLKPGELIYDLGCGDGRLLIMAAKVYGVRAVGFEIALLPYLIAKLKILILGLNKQVKVLYKDFWQIPLSPADAIVCFLTPYAMKKLERKIPSELKPGARFVSYVFQLHSLPNKIVSKPLPTDAPIYLYT
jgi:SAM-dependent methyltransferase